MTAPVTVSVIIPAFNAAETIDLQLASLSQQHNPSAWELIVADNGSTDTTVDRVRPWEGHFENLAVVDASARRGPGAARNIGAAAARGEVLLFCDADDVVAPGWLDAMREAVGSADLVAGTREGRALNREHRAAVSWEVSSEFTMPWWPRYPAASSSNLGVRAEVFRAVGGFDEALRTGEDIDLCWRTQIAGHTFGRAPAAVVHSRRRDGRRAVFDQAFSYGAGHRALKFKYRRFIAADAAEAGASETTSPTPTDPVPTKSSPTNPASTHPGPDRSLSARARRALLTPTGHANVAWRLGEWLGARFGRINDGVRPVEVR